MTFGANISGAIVEDEVEDFSLGLNGIEPLIMKVHRESDPYKIATMHLATPL